MSASVYGVTAANFHLSPTQLVEYRYQVWGQFHGLTALIDINLNRCGVQLTPEMQAALKANLLARSGPGDGVAERAAKGY